MKKKRDAKDVRFAEPQVRHAEEQVDATRSTEAEKAALFWPKGLPRPTCYEPARPAIPCERCDRLLTDDRRQAVICRGGVSRKAGKAYGMTCAACGHVFSMPLGKRIVEGI